MWGLWTEDQLAVGLLLLLFRVPTRARASWQKKMLLGRKLEQVLALRQLDVKTSGQKTHSEANKHE